MGLLTPPALLTVEGVVAGYSAADEILKGVDLTLAAGEIVSVIGPNGAGKSTLLKVIAGLLSPHYGSVRLRGEAIGGRPPRVISALGLAFVPRPAAVLGVTIAVFCFAGAVAGYAFHRLLDSNTPLGVPVTGQPKREPGGEMEPQPQA